MSVRSRAPCSISNICLFHGFVVIAFGKTNGMNSGAQEKKKENEWGGRRRVAAVGQFEMNP